VLFQHSRRGADAEPSFPMRTPASARGGAGKTRT
jgi:hypothetical protein